MRESGWNVHADNPVLGRLRHPAGAARLQDGRGRRDWRTNPATQILWGLRYIGDSYGTPCGAWGFSRPRLVLSQPAAPVG